MSYSCLPALDNLCSGSHLWVFSLGLHLLPKCTLWIHLIHLLARVTSFIPYTSCSQEGLNLNAKCPVTFDPLFGHCLQVSVTLCTMIRITCFHLHKVSRGLPSYILWMGARQTDSHHVYGVVRGILLIVVFGVGTQLLMRPVMMPRSNPWAGDGCYLLFFEVGVSPGRVTLMTKSLRGVRAPNRFLYFIWLPRLWKGLPNVKSLYTIL